MRIAPQWKAVLFLLLFALIGIATWFATAPSRNAAIQVQQQLGRMNDEFSDESRAAMNQILALGPRAYPELRRIITWQETSASRWYGILWNKAPQKLQAYFPRPNARAGLQNNLFENLGSMGPIACRALTGAVCDKIDHGDLKWQEMQILRPLIWSIPGSLRAVNTLSNYLALPTNTFLFGSVYADDLWASVPQLLPLFADWLKKPDAVRDVARGLELVGTNAAFALPLLLQVAENGVAGDPPNTKFRVSFGPNVDPLMMNRGAAVAAIGKIGVTNDAVVAVLQKAASSGNNDLASAAFLTALELGIPLTGALKSWATSWRVIDAFPQEMYRAMAQVSLLGELGLRAAPALPLLKRFAAAEGLREAQRFDHFDPRLIDQLRVTASVAIYKISPDEALPFLPYLLDHYGSWQAASALREWKSQRDRIIPAITAAFRGPARNVEAARLCAFILVSMDADVPDARDLIYGALKSDQTSQRGFAVNWIWILNQDPSEVLPVARELLRTLRDDEGQSALNAFEKMGDAARPALPEIKAALQSPSAGVRDRAGRLLRKLSPAEMPRIIE